MAATTTKANSPVAPVLEGRVTQIGEAAPAEAATTDEAPATLPQSGGVLSLLPALFLTLAGLSVGGAGVWLRRRK